MILNVLLRRFLLTSLAALLGGFLFRVRGGFGGDWVRSTLWSGYGTTSGRLVFAVPSSAMAAIAAGDPWVLCMAPLLFAGLCLGWWKSSDIGRDGDRTRLVEILIMSGRGLLMTGPAGLLLWLWFGFGPWFAASGLALGALYELGHRTPHWRQGFSRGQEWAEVYAGLWLDMWLILTVTGGA